MTPPTSPKEAASRINAHVRQFTASNWPSLHECRSIAAGVEDHLALPSRTAAENRDLVEAFAQALAESCDFDCSPQEAVEETVSDFFFHSIREEEQEEVAAERMHVAQERAAYFANLL